MFYKNAANEKARKEISQMIIEWLKGKKSHFPDLPKFRDLKNLLLTLELFEYRIKGQDWEELKHKMTKTYLLPNARKKAHSPSWVDRNFASRCFALCPLAKDQDILLKLNNDSVFLVRSIAALALVRLEHKAGMIEIIKKMNLEKGYAHYFYRDLLLKCPNHVFVWIQEIAQHEKDPLIHLTCLELLTERTIATIPGYLKEDIHSNNVNIRLAAVKILARNPQKDSADILIKCLEDTVPEIREGATSGLQYFASEEVFAKLEDTLKDSVWLVRLRAAQTLKKMGKKGLDILKHQDIDNKNAYEAAQAVLN